MQCCFSMTAGFCIPFVLLFALQGDRGSAVLRARNATDPEDAGTRALHGLFWRLQGDACLVRTDLQDIRGVLQVIMLRIIAMPALTRSLDSVKGFHRV